MIFILNIYVLVSLKSWSKDTDSNKRQRTDASISLYHDFINDLVFATSQGINESANFRFL